MAPAQPLEGVTGVAGWGRAFDGYLASDDEQLTRAAVAEAQRVFHQLCESQRRVRMLHGDLHHDNVAGAFLRNPRDRPDVFTDARVLETRVACFTSRLSLDRGRILAWAWTQTVLAAIWLVEDGVRIEPGHDWLRLASLLRPLLAYDGRVAP